jgi:cation diffusion facilitator CzcD-associated flavoprotein CzcO
MTTHEVLIIGSGFAGVAAAIQLRQAGVTDVLLLERADTLGGTWRDNHYPGCACDVPSRLYSLSFAPNPDWSHSYSGQGEIQAYLERVAREGRVVPLIRFDHEVTGAQWDATRAQWRVDTNRGAFGARVLVMATGALSDPVLPDVPGRETFAGPAFHSAQWDHRVPLRGRRVAVIGTGASAIQFVPAIQPQVAQLSLFQRTPPWILPRHDRTIGAIERAAYRVVPGLERLARAAVYVQHEARFLAFREARFGRIAQRQALRHLHARVKDPALRAKLTPAYTIGCKRVLVSNDFYPAVAQPNVDVITTGIREVVPEGVVDASGTLHPADVLIYGTGFRPTDPPLSPHVLGRDGRSLTEVWGGSMRAHKGTTVHGFPNLFIMPGPNVGIGHTSMLYMIESQVRHLVHAVRTMRSRGLVAVEPRAESQAAWVADVDARMQRMVWVAGGCSSWYLDATGRNSTLWPDFTWRFRRRVQGFDANEYTLRANADVMQPAGATVVA